MGWGKRDQRVFAILLLIVGLMQCSDDETVTPTVDYRQEMRSFVQEISASSKAVHPGFCIIPQNGEALMTETGDTDAPLVNDYLQAIDGQGREDLFYGYDEDDQPTPADATQEMTSILLRGAAANVRIMVTDYCMTHEHMDRSLAINDSLGFVSFSAPDRSLATIPDYPGEPFHVQNAAVNSLQDVRNFLYLINPENYPDREDYITELADTRYDLLLIDALFQGEFLRPDEVERLQVKPSGNRRLVIAYLSIGEAEDYRWYWKPDWRNNPPSWLEHENPDWPGNYKVEYWNPEWKQIIMGDSLSYLSRILGSGFDGVYLDIIDGYEYYENLAGQ